MTETVSDELVARAATVFWDTISEVEITGNIVGLNKALRAVLALRTPPQNTDGEAVAELIARLRAHKIWSQTDQGADHYEHDPIMGEAASALSTLKAERDSWRRVAEQCEAEKQAAEAERDALAKALEPFAEAADSYDPDTGDGNQAAWAHDFTIASLRRARSTLKGDAP